MTAARPSCHNAGPPIVLRTMKPTFGEMLEELMDLGAGLGVALMPVLLLAMPGIILFVVLPAILLLALAAPLVVIAAPPYLLARWLRRRRRRRLNAPPSVALGPRPHRRPAPRGPARA